MEEKKTKLLKTEANKLYVKSGCKEFCEWYNRNLMIPIALGKIKDSCSVEMPAQLVKEARRKYLERLEEDYRLNQTAYYNNLGIGLEKQGKIDEAVEAYEKNIAIGYQASHAYERLRIIYRKRKDYENMKRVIRRWAEVYGYDDLWIEEEIKRLMPQKGREKPQQIYPVCSHPYIVKGKTFEERFYEIKDKCPEFDFYTKVKREKYLGVGVSIVPFEFSVELRVLRKEIEEMMDSAARYEKAGLMDKAAQIYEKLVGNGVHNTKPYGRLYMIYLKAGLLEEAKRVLESSIDFFSCLRKEQFKEVMQLAEKYHVEKIEGKPIAEYGKIMYYGGMFDLYNPYPIIEKWEEKLKKL